MDMDMVEDCMFRSLWRLRRIVRPKRPRKKKEQFGVLAAKTGPGKSRCFVTNKCKSFWKRRNKKLVDLKAEPDRCWGY